MPKHFVLDTNVLLHDPLAIFRFADNVVVIPIYVLEEIDQFKKELSERGRNAREVCRRLDEFREKGQHLSDGIALPSGGHLRVAIGAREVPAALRAAQIADNLILGVALQVRDTNPETQAILVTKDVNLRIRADAMGLTAEDYDIENISIEELYSGHADVMVPGETIDSFFQDGRIALEALHALPAQATPVPGEGTAAAPPGNGMPGNGKPRLFPNEYLLMRAREGGSQTALGRLETDRAGQQVVVPVSRLKQGVWGIRPKNKEQHFALDLLLNDEVKLVTLVGKAGTGKTLLAIAAGLQKVVEEKGYHKLLVSRPIFPLGRDIGYLPGTMEEKLNPWMQPIYDNVELLLGLSKAEKREGRSHQELIELGYMEIEALTYIRGRSIPNQFMIVDEAQNLTPHEVKTILTRVGDNTKIVLTGDPYQIDNPYVDSTNNGLTTVVERFKGDALAGHVTLVKGERSPLAELASNLL